MGIRIVKWVSQVLLLAVVVGMAHAQDMSGGRVRISDEFWVGLAFSILLALVAGYARGIERRVTLTEHEGKQLQSQINLLRADWHRDHPSRPEFVDFRDDMRDRFDRLESLLRGAPR